MSSRIETARERMAKPVTIPAHDAPPPAKPDPDPRDEPLKFELTEYEEAVAHVGLKLAKRLRHRENLRDYMASLETHHPKD